MRINNVKIQADEGFTFEFYGRNYGGTEIYPLEKVGFDENSKKTIVLVILDGV